jgi:hypothetical protein
MVEPADGGNKGPGSPAVTTTAVTTTAEAHVRPLVRRLREPADGPATGQECHGAASALTSQLPDVALAADAALVIHADRRPRSAASHNPG